MFVNATVLTPAASVKAGSDAVPLTTDSACGGPPFTDALTVHFPPLGAAGTGSVTVHEAPATAPVSVGVALPPFASAAGVQPEGAGPGAAAPRAGGRRCRPPAVRERGGREARWARAGER